MRAYLLWPLSCLSLVYVTLLFCCAENRHTWIIIRHYFILVCCVWYCVHLCDLLFECKLQGIGIGIGIWICAVKGGSVMFWACASVKFTLYICVYFLWPYIIGQGLTILVMRYFVFVYSQHVSQETMFGNHCSDRHEAIRMNQPTVSCLNQVFACFLHEWNIYYRC